MRKQLTPWLIALLIIPMVSASHAQERGTAEDAKSLAEKALAYIQAVGIDRAFDEFSAKNSKWRAKDLYVSVATFDGYTAANGLNHALIGKNVLDLKDTSSKQFFGEMAEAAKSKGSGWVDHVSTDPAANNSTPQSSYVIRIPGYQGFIGVGFHKQAEPAPIKQ